MTPSSDGIERNHWKYWFIGNSLRGFNGCNIYFLGGNAYVPVKSIAYFLIFWYSLSQLSIISWWYLIDGYTETMELQKHWTLLIYCSRVVVLVFIYAHDLRWVVVYGYIELWYVHSRKEKWLFVHCLSQLVKTFEVFEVVLSTGGCRILRSQFGYLSVTE